MTDRSPVDDFRLIDLAQNVFCTAGRSVIVGCSMDNDRRHGDSFRIAEFQGGELQFTTLELGNAEGVTVPTIIIHGTADNNAPTSGAENVLRQIDQAEIVDRTAVGHRPFQWGVRFSVKALGPSIASSLSRSARTAG